MNRRTFLAGAGVAGATITAGAGVRIANLRYYDPESTVPADLPPGERIYRADRLLNIVDHRSVTTETILDDGTDADPYERARYRHEWEPSRRRYRIAYTAFAHAPGDPPPAFRNLVSMLHHELETMDADPESLPITRIQYMSPGVAVVDRDAETPHSPDDELRVSADTVRRSSAVSVLENLSRLFVFILTPDADWIEVDSDDTTVTYELTDREEYAKVPPLAFETVSVDPKSRLRATLDRETGRLLELDDHRVIEQELSSDPEDPTAESQPSDDYGTRMFSYRIKTTFDRYGEATAPMPKGPIPSPSAVDQMRELLSELITY